MSYRVLLRDFMLGAVGPQRPWSRVAIYALSILALVAATNASIFALSVPRMGDDNHGIISLSLAVNRTFCGKPSAVSTGDQIGKILASERLAQHQSIPEVIAGRWSSMQRYCDTITVPLTNNENSLMLAESWIWRAAPTLSAVQVDAVLLALKLACLLFFCVVCLRLGVGVVLCYAMFDVAVAVLAKLQPNFALSTYSFLPCVVIATVALFPLMLSLPDGLGRRVGWPIVAGLWSAFVVNMRTSYLPICVVLALLYISALLIDSNGATAWARTRVQHVAGAVLSLAVGYLVFQYAFIANGRSSGDDRLSHHAVFHPLVLSVGLPVNAFAEREGIEWDDAVGLTLAHRVDPSAQYLTREYERALATYYVSLWKRYPSEMSAVYWQKAKLAGTEMIASADVPDGPVKFARNLLSTMPNGLWLLAIPLVTVFASLRLSGHHRAARELLFTAMGMTAAMLMIESMLIVPRYFLKYHAALLWLYCSLTFIGLQVAITWTAGFIPHVVPRHAVPSSM